MVFYLMKINAKLRNFIVSIVKAPVISYSALSDKKSEGAFFVRFSDYIFVISRLRAVAMDDQQIVVLFVFVFALIISLIL